jgi:hemoglobin-like flavoprotein
MKTVGKAVSMLDDLPALVPVLKELGAKHVNYGVKEAHCEYTIQKNDASIV